jgi:hypothetical protein
MLDLFSSWYGLLFGGGLVTFIVLVFALRWLGVSVQPLVDFIGPILKTLGELIADALRALYVNLKDGASHIAKSGKAILCLLAFGAVCAALVYVPAKDRGAKKQVAELRKYYKFVPRKKPQVAKQWVPSIFGYRAK